MDGADRGAVQVEVVYARSDRQQIVAVVVPAGASIETAIRASGILEHFPEIDLARAAVGRYGARARLTDIVDAGDRIEIYRPLIVDPREARRRRAARKRGQA